MTEQRDVKDFLAQRTLAVVGVSRSGKKFGNMAFRDLKAKGYRVFPVHPSADQIDGERCYRSLKDLPEPAGGVVIVVPPTQTERVVQDAAEAGIRRVWMQAGAESPAAIAYCQQHGLSVIAGECIMMFAEPAGFPHNVHRWFRRLSGKMPK